MNQKSWKFCCQKKTPSPWRSLPWLPRFGFYLDFAGYEWVFKKTSTIEAVLHLLKEGLPASQLHKALSQQLADIKFPSCKKEEIVNTSARTIR